MLLIKPARFLTSTAVQRAASRGVVAVPTTGKRPPTLEEFDPLNPGEWQLGARGKILPRLPEGTKCGKLVMGKYGLYAPKIRKRAEEYSAGLEAGRSGQDATPFDARLTKIAWVLSIIAFIWGLHDAACLVAGRVLWPQTYWVKPRNQ